MKDTRTLNLEKKLASAEAKAQKALTELRAAQADQKQLTRDARTHRLCVHGGLLEKYLLVPEIFDPDDLDRLLKRTLGQEPTVSLIKQYIEQKSHMKLMFGKNGKFYLESSENTDQTSAE